VKTSDLSAQAPLAIDADLTLTRDDIEYRITATDDTVTLDAPSIGAVVSLFRSLPAGALDQLGPLLQTTDVTVVVSVGDQRVATLEPASAWEASDLDAFEVRSVDVHPQGVAVSVLRELGRHPVALAAVALVTIWLVWRLNRRRGGESAQS